MQRVSASAAQLTRAYWTDHLLHTLSPVAEHGGTLKDVVEEVATRLFTCLEPLISESRRRRLLELDPWRDSNRSDVEQTDFKIELLSFYDCAAPDEAPKKHMARCMVSNRVFPQTVVIASHIWKYCTGGARLLDFGLLPSALQSVRNGLLMASEIEAAFDNKRVAFSYDLFKDEFTFHVLDARLMKMPIIDTRTKKSSHALLGYNKPPVIPLFEELDNTPMNWAPKARPFRRLLAWHYALATMMAAQNARWRTPESLQRPASVVGLAEWRNSRSPDATWPSKDVMDMFDQAVSRSERDVDERLEEQDADADVADDVEARGGT